MIQFYRSYSTVAEACYMRGKTEFMDIAAAVLDAVEKGEETWKCKIGAVMSMVSSLGRISQGRMSKS
jgi:hypothetical protein